MENKNNKGLVWLVVILIVLVVALMGFIVYREFYSEEKPSVDNTNTTANVENNGNIITKIENFPKENSDGIKKYSLYNEIFEDQIPGYVESDNLEIHGVNFKFTCVDYEDMTGDGEEECISLDYYVNDKKIGALDLENDETDVIITDEHIIIQDGIGMVYAGDIKIFDKNGNLMKKISNTYKTYLNELQDRNTDTSMKIVDNKVYYIVSNGDSSELETVNFKYLDLKDLTEYSLDTTKGYITIQE